MLMPVRWAISLTIQCPLALEFSVETNVGCFTHRWLLPRRIYRAIDKIEFTPLPISLERACEFSNRGTDNDARKPDTAMPLYGDRRLADETSGRRDDNQDTWSLCCK